MLNKICKKKNSQYEILKILCQNKAHKLKNKVILYKKVEPEERKLAKRVRISNFSMVRQALEKLRSKDDESLTDSNEGEKTKKSTYYLQYIDLRLK